MKYIEKTAEEILRIFKDYIESNELIDVCKTKFGYILLHYNPDRDEIIYAPEIIRTGEEMLQSLREEIILDVIGNTDHDIETASEEELEEIKRRLKPFLDRLQ